MNFQEAGEGKGDILRGIWEQDVSDMKQFYQDQKQNGEYIAYTVKNGML